MSQALDTQIAGSHYKDLAIQPAEYCQRNKLPYCESSVVRYVTRHRSKNGREDIEKGHPLPSTHPRNRLPAIAMPVTYYTQGEMDSEIGERQELAKLLARAACRDRDGNWSYPGRDASTTGTVRNTAPTALHG